MATRALIGFLDDNNEFVGTYNHYDGYPDALGKSLNKFFNSKDAASKLARTGYISSIDPETGEIDSKYDEKPYYKEIDTDDAFTAGMMIGDAVDYFGGDFGYVWVGNEWVTLKNNGVEGMAKQIEDELGFAGGFMVDEMKKDDGFDDVEPSLHVNEGDKTKWAEFITENKVIDDQWTVYVKSLVNSIKLNGIDDYLNFSEDDFKEDFDNYIADKMDM